MTSLLYRVRGRVRLARGRCPACDSEAPAGCGVCLGHLGPFPVEPERLRRWAFRFESLIGARHARVEEVVASGDASPSWAPS